MSLDSSLLLVLTSIVPSRVLQVLTGTGATTGMDIVSNPLVKKVDITVSRIE